MAQATLHLNLKRELDQALKKLTQKEQELEAFKKLCKVTKIKELHEEKKAYSYECVRLYNILMKKQNMIYQRSKSPMNYQDNNNYNPQQQSPESVYEQLQSNVRIIEDL